MTLLLYSDVLLMLLYVRTLQQYGLGYSSRSRGKRIASYHRVADDSGARFTRKTSMTNTLQVVRAVEDKNNTNGEGKRKDVNTLRLSDRCQDVKTVRTTGLNHHQTCVMYQVQSIPQVECSKQHVRRLETCSRFDQIMLKGRGIHSH